MDSLLFFRFCLLAILAFGLDVFATEQSNSVLDTTSQTAKASFIDEKNCANCHPDQFNKWKDSHHALAMQETNTKTVLGDFNNTQFVFNGKKTRFFKSNGDYLVNTEGPDGQLTDYKVKYVFGYTPLQQYLLEYDEGRLQALSIAWDTTNKRWFHLYSNENIDYTDELHWTKPSQNWNSNCAECHSTDLNKNYDPEKNLYTTTFHQVNIGCQSCHGPASIHIQWSQSYLNNKKSHTDNIKNKGFDVDFTTNDNQTQIESCARCHSRRSAINPTYNYGQRLLDTHLPALLEDSLYYDDGQMKDEVYIYGSFIQSKMAIKGVRCGDCHDSHSAKLKTQGNALCTACHNTTIKKLRDGIDTSGLKKKDYDDRSHHFHESGTPGSLCINCHAPKRTYMVVDPRADHSFRIPRPDLSDNISTPNACNTCHQDKSTTWAMQVIKERFPKPQDKSHYGVAINAGRTGKKDAVVLLARTIDDQNNPSIVRATALELIKQYPGDISTNLIINSLIDSDPLIRRTAISGFESAPADQQFYFLKTMLTDPVLAVRIEAARVLASAPLPLFDKISRSAFDNASKELHESYRINLDRVEGHINLGNLHLKQGQLELAEKSYLSAIKFDPVPVVGIINLADLYRVTHRENELEKLLRKNLITYPSNPAIIQSLAFSLIRQQRKVEALELLEQAFIKTSNADIAYLLAIVLNSENRRTEAIKILEGVLPKAQGSRNIILALAAFNKDAGNIDAATSYLKKLADLNPADPALAQNRQ